ncbi:hypothetical protein TrST_g12371 [Triparma strigata]|uniref:Uncharacterized protein n=1 Tax=Triparma strigata TaxID=1606541 RepID=A0A9W7E056_9STRA|nr:hypothetical protein TrST_g12371 [Triparma strigata]
MTYSSLFRPLCLLPLFLVLLVLSPPPPAHGYTLLSSTVTSFRQVTDMARNTLTPPGRRGKGKLSIGVELSPPIPQNPSEVIILVSQLVTSSRLLRESGKCKWCVIPHDAVSGENGWEVDVQPFLTEQMENAPPGNIPEATMVFLSYPKPDFWSEKAPRLKSLGLAGVITSSHSDFSSCISSDLSIVYDVGEDMTSSETLDFSSVLDGLPEVSGLKPSEYLAGIILPPSASYDEVHPEISGDVGDVTDANVSLMPKPTGAYSSIPVIQSTSTIAGSGRLGKTCRVISSRGYPSCLLTHSVSPKSQRSELEKLATFWTLALQSLSRKTSDKFGGFRSKIAIGLKDDVPMQWYNYQKSIMEDGSLGQSTHGEVGGGGDPLDTDNGDYMGF